MIDISDNNILSMHRGDDVCLRVAVQENEFGDSHGLGDDDKVYVGVMEPRGRFEDALIRKVFGKEDMDEDGNVVVKLASSDTISLLPGTYYIQIKLRQKIGESESGEALYDVSTILPKTRLIILD